MKGVSLPCYPSIPIRGNGMPQGLIVQKLQAKTSELIGSAEEESFFTFFEDLEAFIGAITYQKTRAGRDFKQLQVGGVPVFLSEDI